VWKCFLLEIFPKIETCQNYLGRLLAFSHLTHELTWLTNGAVFHEEFNNFLGGQIVPGFCGTQTFNTMFARTCSELHVALMNPIHTFSFHTRFL
jgi:hypothetical protein